MIIKAKYPTIGNEYVGFQGYGSQGNRNSIITNENKSRITGTVNEVFDLTFDNTFK
jgi:hypothetical protein